MKNILATHGIETVINEAFQGAGLGDIPAIECWPELWLVDSSQAELAGQIVTESLKPIEQEAIEWKCSKCGECLGVQFTECWKCGTSR